MLKTQSPLPVLCINALFDKNSNEKPVSEKRSSKYISIYHSNILLSQIKSYLTHIRIASFLWDIGKQCKPRSDAAKRGV